MLTIEEQQIISHMMSTIETLSTEVKEQRKQFGQLLDVVNSLSATITDVQLILIKEKLLHEE